MARTAPRPVSAPAPLRFPRFILGVLAALLSLVAVAGCIARILPEQLQALPYVPNIVALTPWFAVIAAISLLCALVSRRWGVALLALACIGVQVWWQQPFFNASNRLSQAAIAAVSSANPNTDDAYLRVMTLNVYKGNADAQQIVEAVRDERIEVLALQETTDSFVQSLEDAGIHSYLPYSQVSSSDGVYGNGLWSATALGSPSDDDVNSSASFMPGGTVTLNGGNSKLRFVSVHTTSPVQGYWSQWRKSLDELAQLRSNTQYRYVFMGDFNATMDHTPFRNFLGSRFSDAAYQAGTGFTFTWPANHSGFPAFTAIDHVVMDTGIVAGQVSTRSISGSDHKALLATLEVQ